MDSDIKHKWIADILPPPPQAWARLRFLGQGILKGEVSLYC